MVYTYSHVVKLFAPRVSKTYLYKIDPTSAKTSSDISAGEMDLKYIQEVIRQEQSRMFHAVLGKTVGQNDQSDTHIPSKNTHSMNNTQALTALDRPVGPSNATPMERFLTPSPSIDPSGYLFRRQMKESGVGYGSYESTEARAVLPLQWTAKQADKIVESDSSMRVNAASSDGAAGDQNPGNHEPAPIPRGTPPVRPGRRAHDGR